MNAKTLKALRGSIKKWELIVNGKGKDMGAENCPLCIEFDSCENGCPVELKTEGYGCKRSPYKAWNKHQEKVHDKTMLFNDPLKILCPTCKKLAKAELDFLKSLLPEGEMNATKGHMTAEKLLLQAFFTCYCGIVDVDAVPDCAGKQCEWFIKGKGCGHEGHPYNLKERA